MVAGRLGSSLAALALIAAPMHSGDSQIGMGVGMYRSGIVDVVKRVAGMIRMARVRIGRRPAWSLARALVFGFKQGSDLFGRFFRRNGFFT